MMLKQQEVNGGHGGQRRIKYPRAWGGSSMKRRILEAKRGIQRGVADSRYCHRTGMGDKSMLYRSGAYTLLIYGGVQSIRN